MVSYAAHHRRSAGSGAGHRPSRVSGLHYSSTARVNTGKTARIAAASKGTRHHADDHFSSTGPPSGNPAASFIADDYHEQDQLISWAAFSRKFRRFSLRQVSIFLLLVFIIFGSTWIMTKEHASSVKAPYLSASSIDMFSPDVYLPPVPELPGYPYVAKEPIGIDEIQWLRDNTYLTPDKLSARAIRSLIASRPKATFLSLARNSELDDMISSISQVESRFNGAMIHRYDWIFFNNEPFTEEFQASVTNVSSGRCFFELIPQKHWAMPEWIDESRFGVGREFMGSIGVGKSWLESYHHMCRWNSGLFAMEDRLRTYDYYWRVEPGVQFTCNINYDVFRFMRDNGKSYGFNMAILDDARSFPSLWDRTRNFRRQHSEMLHEQADMEWLLHTKEELGISRVPAGLESPFDEEEYNNCQFYSNFEIGSLNFFRGQKHQAYFNHLDQAGGFYYERYGDAPVHTLSVSMFLPKSSIWFFRDIGYAHGLCKQCPPHGSDMGQQHERERDDEQRSAPADYHKVKQWLARDVKRQEGIPGLQCGCTTTTLDENFSKLVPFESKQRKPLVSCIRRWLARLYILPNETRGPLADVIAAGGDGYGGWLIEGIESNPFIKGGLQAGDMPMV